MSRSCPTCAQYTSCTGSVVSGGAKLRVPVIQQSELVELHAEHDAGRHQRKHQHNRELVHPHCKNDRESAHWNVLEDCNKEGENVRNARPLGCRDLGEQSLSPRTLCFDALVPSCADPHADLPPPLVDPVPQRDQRNQHGQCDADPVRHCQVLQLGAIVLVLRGGEEGRED